MLLAMKASDWQVPQALFQVLFVLKIGSLKTRLLGLCVLTLVARLLKGVLRVLLKVSHQSQRPVTGVKLFPHLPCVWA